MDLEDPQLRNLADALPNTILQSRANSTSKKYLSAFRRWKAWAMEHSMVVFPAQVHQVALYLQYVGETTRSKSAVEEAFNALSWIHALAGLDSPMCNPFLRSTLEGLQRTLAKPVIKKKPVSVNMLEAIVQDARDSESLSDIRLATACLLSYAGFLRFNELVRLRPVDIIIEEGMMSIHIVQSKTDQLRKGDEIVVARTKSATCPVAMLEYYLKRTGMSLDDQRFLFRPIQRTSKGETLRSTGCISYSCLRDLFKRKLRDLGFQPEEFGLHGLRAGGATAAANANVPDRLFKRHGRWRSENAKDGYIEDDVAHRLEVTQKLGL